MENLPVSVTDMLSGLEAMTADAAPTGDYCYMKMTKAGEWLFGQDNDEAEEGSQWVIDPRESQAGFISWGDGGPPVGEVMGGGKRPPVNRNELPDTGFAWDVQKAVQMMCLTGADAGVAALYKTNSKGGLTAVSRLIMDVTARARSGNPAVFPVVTLHHTTGKSNWGMVSYPELKQVNWLTVVEFDEAVEAANSDAEALPEPTPEPEPATPIRRRRKRS